MTIYNLYETLTVGCGDDWAAYIQHEFVRGLGDGSLPRTSFQYYLRQDYFFLIHFARTRLGGVPGGYAGRFATISGDGFGNSRRRNAIARHVLRWMGHNRSTNGGHA